MGKWIRLGAGICVAGLLVGGALIVLGTSRSLTPGGKAPSAEAQMLPPFDGATAWLNTSEPIAPAQLRGKVVLIVFWASSNANILRVLPTLKAWYAQYHPVGLELIGVHSPEFSFERSTAHVELAVERLGIPFPVVVDSERRVWAAYRAQEWPSYYVADPHGRWLGFQIGVGREAEVERYVRQVLTDHGLLLKAPAIAEWITFEKLLPVTPEFVLALPVGPWFASPETPVLDEPRVYSVPPALPLRALALDGVWQFDEDGTQVAGPGGRLVVRYQAPRCRVVLEGEPLTELEVRLDGRPVPPAWCGPDLRTADGRSMVILDHPRSYHLVEASGDEGDHVLELILPHGVTAYSFASH